MTKTSLLSQVSRTIHSRNLFNNGDTIIVALSGGADSCALLDILMNLKNMSLNLIAVHINHCLRGKDSDADEDFVRNLSRSYGIPFESCRIDVADIAKEQGLNLEDAGRRARMKFLEEMRIKYHAKVVALAHHSDDQAETILMRLLRGSGSTGLSGMTYCNGSLVRPLLEVTRAEIISHIESSGLAYREDVTNLDTDFLRNRIRHELIPLLCEYNPNIQKRLNITGNVLADESIMLDKLAEELLVKTATFESNKIRLELKLITEEPTALKRRLFRLTLERLAGNLNDFSYLHIEALLNMLESLKPNSQLNLPHGITAVKQYETIILSSSSQSTTIKYITPIINSTGTYRLDEFKVLAVSIVSRLPDYSQSPKNVTFIDLKKAPFPWIIRFFEPGDRISPFGMQGTKKVKDLFIDKKLPLSDRKQTPLIFSNDNLIWVCGICSSETTKVDLNSTVILKVTLTDTSKH